MTSQGFPSLITFPISCHTFLILADTLERSKITPCRFARTTGAVTFIYTESIYGAPMAYWFSKSAFPLAFLR